VTVVVISSGEKGDRLVGSLDAKVPDGRGDRLDPHRGASNLAGCSRREPVCPEIPTCGKRICRINGRAELFSPLGEGPCRNRKTGYARFLVSPGTLRAACQKRVVSESPEPLVGSLGRRDRHSEGVAYNRPMQGNCDVPASGADGADISDEGPGQHNPDRSEGPRGRAAVAARTTVPHRAHVSDAVRGTT
jgi:hypothetical protein